MAELKPGRIVEWHRLSPSLSLFRVIAMDGARFPSYEAGQYIALRRDDCLLTRKVKDGNEVNYVPDLDAEGKQKRGSVTHSYSISSAPFETAEGDYLEFYVVLERGRDGVLGRFTESLFRGVESHENDRLAYVERIVGDFTLAKRAAGFDHVLMVGTGTGLAPFVSMVKQLDHEARNGKRPAARYTLLHANRTHEELAYHGELLDIEKSNSFDLVYSPSGRRPAARHRPGQQPAAPCLRSAGEGSGRYGARVAADAAARAAEGADRARANGGADLWQPRRDGGHRLDRRTDRDAIRERGLVTTQAHPAAGRIFRPSRSPVLQARSDAVAADPGASRDGHARRPSLRDRRRRRYPAATRREGLGVLCARRRPDLGRSRAPPHPGAGDPAGLDRRVDLSGSSRPHPGHGARCPGAEAVP